MSAEGASAEDDAEEEEKAVAMTEEEAAEMDTAAPLARRATAACPQRPVTSQNTTMRAGAVSTSPGRVPQYQHWGGSTKELKRQEKARNFARKNEERYAWLDHVCDASGRPEGTPDYDPSTLYIPASAFRVPPQCLPASALVS
jgi:DNA mismatch repair protein MSH6